MPPKLSNPAVKHPKRKKVTLKEVVEKSTPRHEYVPDLPRWLSTEKLHELVSEHLASFHVARSSIGREALFDIAIKLNIVPISARQQAPPRYLSNDELRALLSDAKVGYPSSADRAMLVAVCVEHGLIDTETASATRTRPDKAAALSASKDCDEVCFRCSLSALLRGVDNKDQIIETIHDIAKKMSRIIHQRSILAWLHFHRLLKNGRPLPDIQDSNATFFRHCFTVGVERATTRDVDIQETLDAYQDVVFAQRDLFQPIGLPRFASNVMSHAAKLYKTNVVNHLTRLDVVLQRIKRYASLELFGVERDADVDDDVAPVKGVLHSVMCAIESGDVPDGMHPTHSSIVFDVRRRFKLDSDEVLTENLLKRRIRHSLQFALDVAERIDDAKKIASIVEEQGGRVRYGVTRGIMFMPIHNVALHAVTLDASDLAEIVMQTNTLAFDVVREFFKDGIARQFGSKYSNLFTGTLTTDGTSVSVHFRKPGKKARREDATTNQRKEASEESAEKLKQVPEVLLFVDVGRVRLLNVTVHHNGAPYYVERPDAKIRGRKRRLTFKLTAKGLYSASGVTHTTHVALRQRRRSAVLRQLDTAMQRVSLKTGDAAQVVRHLRLFNTSRRDAWVFATSRSSAKRKLRNWAGRARALDRFFSSMKKRLVACFGSDAVNAAEVVWGSAKVSPSGRGNVTVPTLKAYRVACRHFHGRIHLGDEYNTSQTCSLGACYTRLNAVRVAAPFGVSIRARRIQNVESRSMAWRIRNGLVQCRNHKRPIRQPDVARVRSSRIKVCRNKTWRIDGHSGEDDATKQEKMKKIEEAGEESRYLRGLRFCQECLKFFDRDHVGCEGIGTIWKAGRGCMALPAMYDRKATRCGKRRKRGVAI